MDKLTQSLLYLDGVTVSFDGFRALNNLSFAVEPGEMRAIIGPNGAGKTTMMDVITGKTRPDSGAVIFNGRYSLMRRDETEIAELFYTSGSTGNPKGVMLSHRTLFVHALLVGLAVALRDDTVELHTIPLFHANGWGRPQLATMV